MAEDEFKKAAVEQAARAIHEYQAGAGSWATAKSDQRSQSRQAVRLMMAAFEKNGFDIRPKVTPPPGGGSRIIKAPGSGSRARQP